MMYFRIGVSRQIVDLEVTMPSTTSIPSPSPSTPFNDTQKANLEWKDVWVDWVEFNKEL